MEMRKLGSTGIEIAPLVLGGNVFGWTADKAASFRILDRFAEAGGVMIDTADVYSAWVPGHSGGESETVIGEWLKASGKRDAVQIPTLVAISTSSRLRRRFSHSPIRVSDSPPLWPGTQAE